MAEEELFPEENDQIEQAEPAESPEPAAETPAEPAPVEAAKEPVVPLAALQEARGENRSLKDRLANIEAMLMRQQPQPERPDLLGDPDGYAEMIDRRIAMRDADMIATMSEMQARLRHGDDVVNEAFAASQEAGVTDQFRGRRDAWGDLVTWHKAQKARAEIGDDPAAYRARLEADLRAKILAEMAAKPAAIPAAPTLAGQANLGTRTPSWGGPTPMEDILGKRE